VGAALGGEGGLQGWLGAEGAHHLGMFAGFATGNSADAAEPARAQTPR